MLPSLPLLLTLTSLLHINPTTSYPLQKRLAEDIPWHLTSLALFTPSNPSSKPPAFSFHFSDTNPGLELETTCVRTLPPGSGGSAVDGERYFDCSDSNGVGTGVAFRLGEGGKLDVKRGYRDDAVGPPPYSYVTAFGHTTLAWVRTEVEGGVWHKVEAVDVVVTEMIA